jgi:rhamnosyltransferase
LIEECSALRSTNICIILATYNGAPYIEEQIESIQAQTCQDWILLVRDDGSTDGTVGILASLAAEDERINVLDETRVSSGGAVQNFGRLMEVGLETESCIFFLCDQDDVWEPHKLEAQIQEFPYLGREASSVLVHSDLAVVDAELNSIHTSMVDHMALDVCPSQPFGYLLSRNFVTGCATACNRRLLKEALPIPEGAIMHDWWLAIVASINGTILFKNEPLVNYRQHMTNTIGARGFWQGLDPSRNWFEGWRAGNSDFLETFEQADALLDRSNRHPEWPMARIKQLKIYTRLLQYSLCKRLWYARWLGLRQGSLLLRAIYCIRLLTIRKRPRSGRGLKCSATDND